MKQLMSFLQNFAMTDVIDILIVTILIYRFLLIIKGTRAVQMLIGLGALLFLFAISVSYRLYSLNWLLSHFFESFFLILIILFQDHIRSALVNFGGTRILSKKERLSSMDVMIEEVVNAVGALSREKTGALIVFEQQNGLLNYTGTGTNLDARIHSDIIYSLFQEISPLHDGAIIISQGRIKAAGCFLPLSKNVDIDRHFGTRHRAAIGISELTDAVVVTVSEETGKIHVCHQGLFVALDDQTELRSSLYRLLVEEKALSLEKVGVNPSEI